MLHVQSLSLFKYEAMKGGGGCVVVEVQKGQTYDDVIHDQTLNTNSKITL